LQKTCFLDILAVFRLDFGQISFNPVENAFATQQLAVVTFWLGHALKSKFEFLEEKVTYVLRLFDF